MIILKGALFEFDILVYPSCEGPAIELIKEGYKQEEVMQICEQSLPKEPEHGYSFISKRGVCFVRMYDSLDSMEGISVFSHELYHCVNRILDRCQVKLKDEELVGRMIQHYTKQYLIHIATPRKHDKRKKTNT